MGAYSINIVGLKPGTVHQFDYDFGDEFFAKYGTHLIEKGSFHADVVVNKHETFLEVDFSIKGIATLICDRSLEPFEYPIKNSHRVVFKYGDQDEELTDEIVMIHRDTVTLELGQYLYEFIGLDVPMKKLHPRFKNEDEGDDEASEGKIVYSSGGDSTEDDSGDENIDPRWNILKKLK